jgi:hypothetical protein
VIKDTQFLGSYALVKGGGLAVIDYKSLSIEGSLFQGNIAED